MKSVSECKSIAKQLEIVRLSNLSFELLLEEAGISEYFAKMYHITRQMLIKDLSE